MEPKDETRLNECLNAIIAKIDDVIQQLQRKRVHSSQPSLDNGSDATADPLLESFVQNNDAYAFSVDEDERDMLALLTNHIQHILQEHWSKFSVYCSNYIGESLHPYEFDAEKRSFTEILSPNLLYPLKHTLKSLLVAAHAYPAALRGKQEIVEAFLRKYPEYKNKPGFWGTTLLYSAAKGNWLNLVRTLVETFGCSVNAKNQGDLNYLLIDDYHAKGKRTSLLPYKPDPRLASTPLHAACYNNNLETVKYLFEKGADYYSRNQLGETPIQNGRDHKAIQNFFREKLISSYVNPSSCNLPQSPTLECYDRRPTDCIWEYKPIKSFEWEVFTPAEHEVLSAALHPVGNRASFDPTTYLNVRKGIYNVNILIFFRAGRNQDPNPKKEDSSAWIRCRGSSILNFNMYCNWQLMFVKYDSKHKSNPNNDTPLLNAEFLPSVYDSKFRIKLNSWYTCDSNRSSILDDAMNYRRRYIQIDCNFELNGDAKKMVTCNLFEFRFSNESKTIVGFIRWIPKLIENTPNNGNVVRVLDNFKINNNVSVIPLAIDRFEGTTDVRMIDHYDESRSTDWETSKLIPKGVVVHYDNDKEEKRISDVVNPDIGTWNLSNILVDKAKETTGSHFSEPDFNEFINQRMMNAVNLMKKVSIQTISEENQRSKQETAERNAKLALEQEIERFRLKELELLKKIEDGSKASKEQKDQMKIEIEKMKNDLKELQQQLQEKNKKEEQIKRISEQITTKEYALPPFDQGIILKFELMRKVIGKIDYPMKFYFADNIPQLVLNQYDSNKIALRALPIHHQAFEKMLNGIQKLFYDLQSCKEFFNDRNQKRIRSILSTISKLKTKNPNDWKSFSSSLERLIEEKSETYVKQFGVYLNSQCNKLLDDCIRNCEQSFQEKLMQYTREYIKRETFLTDMDKLKPMALDEFIEKRILSQENSKENKATKESALVLKKFIDKIKRTLETGDTYDGFGSKNLGQIALLLQRLMIFYHCFLVQLPLFNASFDLLNQIESHTVITISTATGSGKSTLLPPLLAADGYGRILVTQPRRLPCTLLSKRVNTMIKSNISGWEVSGDHSNKNAQIIYLTDGLLKEQLLNNMNLITEKSKVTKAIVFFIDEVHERSINIDLCLALFARLLKLQPQLKNKMKLIISSATLDPSVPALFRNLPGRLLAEFDLASLSKLHPVTEHHVPGENMLDLVQKLYSQRKRFDQILCFVNETKETHENCDLLRRITQGTVVAHPLIQAQSAIEQQRFIEEGCVFFSTTVAETSLTFPCLKYVIDTGLINIPVYNIELQRTELKEKKCSLSTTKQRLGRLGRTQPGEYYALYNYSPGEQEKYPQPLICQSDLATIEFSLRKSPLRLSLKVLQEFLPRRPESAYIDDAIRQLTRIDLVNRLSTDRLTKTGAAIAKLPDFASLPMSKAVHAALTRYRCGRDLIVLSSVLSVLNKSNVLKSIPSNYKKDNEGDLMTLLNMMNDILDARSVPANQFDVNQICAAKGLSAIAHIIKPAFRRYQTLEEAFKVSKDFKELAQMESRNWEQIAKALLVGFSDNVFVSLKTIQGRTQHYVRYNEVRQVPDADKQDSLSQTFSTAMIDRSSVLKVGNRGAVPASIVLARDVRYLSAIRSSAVLSFVGKIEPAWLEYSFTRQLKLNPTEEKRLIDENILQNVKKKFGNVHIRIDRNTLIFQGQAGQIFEAEREIRRELTSTLDFKLEPQQPDNPNNNLTRNLKAITGMPGDLFGPLRWRWEWDQQVEMVVKMNKKEATISVKATGLDSQNEQVRKEFKTFFSWLDRCAVIRHPDAGVGPRVLKPQIRDKYREMELRIGNITDPDRTTIDIWKGLKGPNATRTTRMEVVAWVAVCNFHCRLEGGFVRDWVVAGYSSTPNLPTDQWVVKTSSDIPKLHPKVIPADLDCHLPQSKRFDLESFLDILYEYDIPVRSWRQDWRYVLLLDENTETGPFAMDLIEPHIALTHDRIDFDVNNLSLERGYTKDLGMRVDITVGANPISLETIVENIQNKNFQVLRPIDGEISPNSPGTVADRVQKMISRGWTHIGDPFSFVPDPPSHYDAVLTHYPSKTILYASLVTELSEIAGAKIVSIQQIKNPNIEALYENMKRTIAQECPGNNPQEKELFHGTSGEAISGIICRGFDDRYFSQSGHWGSGAYFANNPAKSHAYTDPDPATKHRVIFYTKVLLGVESKQNSDNKSLTAAPIGHHSVHGNISGYHEYVVYRYGQALPYLKITYKA